MKRVIFSDGQKGGVGKSFFSITLVDYLLATGAQPLVIESDTNNPDVGRIYNDHVECTTLFLDLKTQKNWMDLTLQLEDIYEVSDYCVINLPAGGLDRDYLNSALTAFRALGYTITTFFTINRELDSLNLLSKSLNSGLLFLSDEKIVVKNGKNGLEDSFHRFDDSKTKKEFFSAGGQVLYLRELFYYSSDLCLIEKKKNFSEALKDRIKLAYRYQISLWLDEAHCKLDDLLESGSNKKGDKIPYVLARENSPLEARERGFSEKETTKA
jgi:hypothetical protein